MNLIASTVIDILSTIAFSQSVGLTDKVGQSDDQSSFPKNITLIARTIICTTFGQAGSVNKPGLHYGVLVGYSNGGSDWLQYTSKMGYNNGGGVGNIIRQKGYNIRFWLHYTSKMVTL